MIDISIALLRPYKLPRQNSELVPRYIFPGSKRIQNKMAHKADKEVMFSVRLKSPLA